jgi:hypothetical protein
MDKIRNWVPLRGYSGEQSINNVYAIVNKVENVLNVLFYYKYVFLSKVLKFLIKNRTAKDNFDYELFGIPIAVHIFFRRISKNLFSCEMLRAILISIQTVVSISRIDYQVI